MALRDQPYLPLYVQDFATDERLIECSAAATGVYIRLMCIMHKSDEYGVIRLRPKDCITGDTIDDFAGKLMRQMPYDIVTISDALRELIDEGVLNIEGDRLYQRRMVRDAKLSDKRRAAGRQRGTTRQQQREQSGSNPASKAESKSASTLSANTENEDDNDTDNVGTSNYVGISNKPEPRAHAREETRAVEPGGGDPALAKVMTHYQDNIGLTMSSASVELLIAYTAELGADVVCHAIDVAIEHGARNWAYIKGVLQSYQRDGIRSLADIDRREEQRARSQRGGNGNARTYKPAGEEPDIVYDVDGMAD